SSSLADVPDPCVVAFERGVGEPVRGPGDHAVHVAHQHLPELDEGLQPGPVKRLAPAHQESPHALLGRVGPGVLELLLEYVGSEQVAVLRQEHREVPAFATSEPAVLAKQQPLLAAHSLAELPTASPELALAN